MKNFFYILFLTVLTFACFEQHLSAQNIKFNHTYGSMLYNYGRRIIETGNRDLMILANVSADSGSTNISIIRTDSMGIIKSEKNIGDGSVYYANDFIRTTDNGYLICGLTNKIPSKSYDMLLIKIDSNCTILWERNYGGSDWDIASAVKETKDSAYILVGKTYSYGPANENIYIVKTNYSGDTIWTKTFGGDSTDYATSVDILYDSTYLIGATTNSFGYGNYDGYVLNLNFNGDTIWTKNYGEENDDIINSISQTPDSGFVFVGSTKNYGAIQQEIWLRKYDKNSVLRWKIPEYWEIYSGDQIAYNISVTNSSIYLISGYTNGAGNGAKDIAFYVFDENHVYVCGSTAGSIENEEGFQAIQTADKGYAIIGYSEELGTGLSNIYVVKLGENCSFSSTTEHITDVEENPDSQVNNNFGIYPNISCGEFFIKINDGNSSEKYYINVNTIFGQEIFSDKIESLTNAYNIDLTAISDGMYIVTLFSSKNKNSFKIIKCSK